MIEAVYLNGLRLVGGIEADYVIDPTDAVILNFATKIGDILVVERDTGTARIYTVDKPGDGYETTWKRVEPSRIRITAEEQAQTLSDLRRRRLLAELEKVEGNETSRRRVAATYVTTAQKGIADCQKRIDGLRVGIAARDVAEPTLRRKALDRINALRTELGLPTVEDL